MSHISDHIEIFLEKTILGSHSKDLSRLYLDIMKGRISSRREFSATYGLRSSTVSELVNELVGKKLIYEVADVGTSRGRPAKKLVLNQNLFVVCVVRISSQTLICNAVNITGQVIEETRSTLSSSCNNRQMIAEVRKLYGTLLEKLPAGVSCIGMVFSLPGILSIERKSWIMSSRWPEINNLPIEDELRDMAVPIKVVRNIDSELRARLFKEDGENILLLHWGFGIGIAYSEGGDPINSKFGRFGEIGHWDLGVNGTEQCRCGRNGCLEVHCALWSIWPDMARTWPELSKNEEDFMVQAAKFPLLEHDKIQQAVDMMVTTLGNLCRVLFPSKILLSGHFFANDEVLAEFYRKFLNDGVLPHVSPPKLTYVQQSEQLETEGAAIPVIVGEIEGRLRHGKG